VLLDSPFLHRVRIQAIMVHRYWKEFA
jgi:hypothetical protein